LATAAFIATLILNRLEKTVPVVTAAANLPAGRELVAADQVLREIPETQSPDGPRNTISQAVDLVLPMPRAAGAPMLTPPGIGSQEYYILLSRREYYLENLFVIMTKSGLKQLNFNFRRAIITVQASRKKISFRGGSSILETQKGETYSESLTYVRFS